MSAHSLKSEKLPRVLCLMGTIARGPQAANAGRIAEIAFDCWFDGLRDRGYTDAESLESPIARDDGVDYGVVYGHVNRPRSLAQAGWRGEPSSETRQVHPAPRSRPQLTGETAMCHICVL